MYFFLVERRRHKSVCFFFIHLRDIPRRYALSAVRAEDGSVILREVDGAIYDPIVVHLHEIALPDLLIIGDKAFAIGAAHFQNMASSDLFTIRVFINFQRFQRPPNPTTPQKRLQIVRRHLWCV